MPQYRNYRPPTPPAPEPARQTYSHRPGYVRYSPPQDVEDYDHETDDFDYDDDPDAFDEDDIPTEEFFVSSEAKDEYNSLRNEGLPVSMDTALDNGYVPYRQVRVPNR